MKRNVQIYLLLFACLLSVANCTKTPEPNTSPPPPSAGTPSRQQTVLATAVQETNAQSANGKRVSFLCDLSEQHLDYMIAQEGISHDGFQNRYQLIVSKGGTNVGEIVAYNCGQDSLESAAQQCAHSWVQSSGHWELMKKYWDDYCYAMKQAPNGCYYCIGLFANGPL